MRCRSVVSSSGVKRLMSGPLSNMKISVCLTRSPIYSAAVMRLKPKRASIAKVRYISSGRPSAPMIRSAVSIYPVSRHSDGAPSTPHHPASASIPPPRVHAATSTAPTMVSERSSRNPALLRTGDLLQSWAFIHFVGRMAMAQDPLNLIWIDLEMTGLDTQRDYIIEIATVVTDGALNVLAEGPVIAIHQPDTVLGGMDKWNQ